MFEREVNGEYCAIYDTVYIDTYKKCISVYLERETRGEDGDREIRIYMSMVPKSNAFQERERERET